MTQSDIISLATELFLRYPYDSPDRLFKLSHEWLVYCEAWELQHDLEPIRKGLAVNSAGNLIATGGEFDSRFPPTLDEIIDSSPLDGAGG